MVQMPGGPRNEDEDDADPAVMMLQRFERATHAELCDVEGSLWDDLDDVLTRLRREMDPAIFDRIAQFSGLPVRTPGKRTRDISRAEG